MGNIFFFDRSQDIRTSNKYLFDKEAIIVPGEGQEFIPKFYIGKFDLHQRTYAIFDFVNAIGKYIFFHMLNDNRHLKSQAVGSTVKSLRFPMFQSMPIKFPSIEEQTKISNFLSSVDIKIEIENNLLEKLKKAEKVFFGKFIYINKFAKKYCFCLMSSLLILNSFFIFSSIPDNILET
ncbi:restriction endonuclease subunit S [Chryseobacterium sp. P1-3]|uniref:restriction endonuclease subunit S n=1 Tax=Chryseobacterium sp. (strain P1-3) TaxID=1517683 RepID=UPI000679976E|nr:restriction endonuclease subunit S [Chryseobacterium sp. P1-3]